MPPHDAHPDATIALTAAGVTVLIDATAGRLPAVVHWGPELPGLDAGTAAALVGASRPVVGSNNIQPAPRVSVLPEHHTGWTGRPGLRGSRAGRDWSPSFTTRSIMVDGAAASGFVA
jgi:alpha-galactosidase